ncbi:S8 family serine peptidase [candidate division KSB1 bacterium]|nr:S8 family serine peptidase [candidate division KSB1 bacterium]
MKKANKMNFKEYTGRGIKVAIIDSGIDSKHPDVENLAGGVRISFDSRKNPVFSDDYSDFLGHGTACAGIIKKKAPDVELYAVRIFDNDLSTNALLLIEAIRWAADNSMDVVNLSLGVTDPEWAEKLQAVSDYAAEQNTILVAAEDNRGAETFPASFANVFGVTGGKVRKKYGFYYRRNCQIDFVARGDKQRLCWLNPRYIFMGGTSFATPHLTGIIALIREKYPNADYETIKDILIDYATDGEVELVREIPDYQKYFKKQQPAIRKRRYGKKYKWIKKAALYPFTKEMHSLIRYRDLIDFEITGIADTVGKGYVGKDAGEAIGIEPVGLKITHKLEQAIEQADTLILGYVDQLSRITQKDVLKETIETALSNGKNVFSFNFVDKKRYPELYEMASQKKLKIIFPNLTRRHFNQVLDLRNQEVDKPVMGVFGTSSQQGKFTVQLALRRELIKLGLNVGQIGTEHHSELLGFDMAFPIGYSPTVTLPLNLYIPFLSLKMAELSICKNADIIIVGGQSGIIPYDINDDIPAYLPAMAFLFGTQPDAYILTVNSIDPDEYIRDSIHALEALGKGKTILLTMSDKEKNIQASFGTSRVISRQLSESEIADKLNYLEQTFKIPATEVISEQGQQKMVSTIIDYFSDS